MAVVGRAKEAPELRREAEAVKRFYDSFGWQKDQHGLYKDTAAFVDTRAVLDWYSHATNMRVSCFFAGGKYFLDAGSGAIAYPEYLRYSSGYERRVCVDISETALGEARSKLGEKGWYVLADLAHLPFRDGVFDATISAHVLYHVPKEDQHSVILELCRALAPKGVCVVIYSQFTSLLHLIPAPLRRTGKILRPAFVKLKFLISKGHRQRDEDKGISDSVPALYAYAYDIGWFRRILPLGWSVDVRSWRSVDADFTKRFIPNNLLGRYTMKLIFLLETLFPWALARIGYQMIIIRKASPMHTGDRG